MACWTPKALTTTAIWGSLLLLLWLVINITWTNVMPRSANPVHVASLKNMSRTQIKIPHNEIFVPVEGTEMFVRSPFLDTRIEGHDSIRMWVITPWDHPAIYCHVTFKNSSRRMLTVKARVKVQKVFVAPHCKWFTATMRCSVPKTEKAEYVAISRSQHRPKNSSWHRITIPSYKAPQSPKYGICLGTLFDLRENDTHRVVEWFEMQKLLGVHNVMLYGVANVSTSVLKALRLYEKSGFLVYDPWQLPVRSLTKNIYLQKEISEEYRRTRSKNSTVQCVTYYAQHLSYMDCLYRYVDSFTHLAYFDLDEYLIPSNNYSWAQMFDELESNSSHATSYYFSEACFDSAVQSSLYVKGASMNNIYMSTNATQRLPEFQLNVKGDDHGKSVLKPSKVIFTYVHHIDQALSGLTPIKIIDPKIGRINHYRYPTGKCKATSDSVIDSIMSRYHRDLLRNMERTLSELKKQ